MKWYNMKKYRPSSTGDRVIFRTLNGHIYYGYYDYQKDKGAFFETDDALEFKTQEITHFCIPDPIDID